MKNMNTLVTAKNFTVKRTRGNAALQGLFVLVVIALIIFLCYIGPIWTIGALNLLFGLNIAVNLQTWLATFWLMIVVAAKNYSK